jgi:hypothetical protein
MLSEAEFEDFVKDHLAGKLASTEVVALSRDQNLIGSGLIDSFIFIDLCLAIEERAAVPVDIAEIDFDDFSISGLWRYIENSRSRAVGAAS